MKNPIIRSVGIMNNLLAIDTGSYDINSTKFRNIYRLVCSIRFICDRRRIGVVSGNNDRNHISSGRNTIIISVPSNDGNRSLFMKINRVRACGKKSIFQRNTAGGYRNIKIVILTPSCINGSIGRLNFGLFRFVQIHLAGCLTGNKLHCHRRTKRYILPTLISTCWGDSI